MFACRLLCLAIAAYTLGIPGSLSGDDGVAEEFFQRRILPIAKSEQASSCAECHFGGVDLSDYIRDDQQSTFAALRQQGLIDPENPDASKILTFIARHRADSSPQQAATRKAELLAFRDWIRLAVRDPNLLAAQTDVRVGIELDPEVIRHLRSDRVLEAFYREIWVEMARCINCHSPDRNEKQVAKNGEQMSWIVPGDPEATLKKCVEQGIIDLEDPLESELLTKPLMLVEHGGGPKFVAGGETDKAFRRFLVDYARTVAADYQTPSQLPALASTYRFPTDQFLRITNVPAEFGGKYVQVRLYRWTDAGWSEDPVAMGENPARPKQRIWQSVLFELIPHEVPAASAGGDRDRRTMRGGRFQARVFIDQAGRLKSDPEAVLDEGDLVASIDFQGALPSGFKNPRIIHWPAPTEPPP